MSTTENGPLTVCAAKQLFEMQTTPSAERTLQWLKSLSTENIDRVELLMRMSYNAGKDDGRNGA